MFPIGHVFYFKKTADEDQFEDLVKQINENLGVNDQILLKGSNSMNLAKLVESLEKGCKWFCPIFAYFWIHFFRLTWYNMWEDFEIMRNIKWIYGIFSLQHKQQNHPNLILPNM